MANILDGKYVSKNFKVYGTSAVFEISHNRQETGLLIGICKTHAILSPFKDPTLASNQKHLFEICLFITEMLFTCYVLVCSNS